MLIVKKQALEILKRRHDVKDWIRLLLNERASLMYAINELNICTNVYPTEANFFLAQFTDADKIYNYLVNKGIIVRNRSHVTLCDNCLRITIGTPQENTTLLSALRQYQ